MQYVALEDLVSLRYVMVPVSREILDRLKEYLESQHDTETTYSSIIANWIDKQKIADMNGQESPFMGRQ